MFTKLLISMVFVGTSYQLVSAGGPYHDHRQKSEQPVSVSSSSEMMAGSSNTVVADAGDPVAGKEIYSQCGACHSLGRNRTGPLHCGVVGRKAGTAEGYGYSDVMENSDIVWDTETLDEFLTAPLVFMPGTTMGFAGVKDSQVRKDLIAYLSEATVDSDECLQ